jgi:glycosyltransferase involved in cell wall biosynthesis
MRTLLAALGQPVTSRNPTTLTDQVARALAAGRPDEIWLALAVLTATLPGQNAVLRAVRSTRLDGPLGALTEELHRTVAAYPDAVDIGSCPVEVVTGQVVVDVNNTSRTDFATGIQRVVRETTRRWVRDHDPVLIGWSTDRPAMRRLLAGEVRRTLEGGVEVTLRGRPATRPVLVPWRSRYVLPELIAELDQVGGLHSMFRFSGNTSAVIGYDCVPLTVPETVQAEAVVNGFAALLSALAHVDRLAPISHGAAGEYSGWRTMLAGAGLTGPEITTVSLAVDTVVPTENALAAARRDLIVAGLPMVLVVGSHEPRKNHLAVLHAAELLWRSGLKFSLLFIGGNTWNSERFQRRLAELKAGNRPIDMITAAADEQLWAAYYLARCTVFPSLDEGFGLPVAESLASGTPTITSDFGSMREIAEAGGALLVDSRDDHDIADAIRRLLTDDDLQATLAQQARDRPIRSWDEYAAETWTYLVDGVKPGRAPKVSAIDSADSIINR